jgi:hypothetical protein
MTFKLLSTLAIFVYLLTIWGCVSEPVAVSLPADHPADPGAAETAYAVVPNPFRNNGLMDKIMVPDGDSTPHQRREESPGHKMKPMHDKGQKDPEKSGQPHQEHN